MDFSVVNLSYDYSEELGEVCVSRDVGPAPRVRDRCDGVKLVGDRCGGVRSASVWRCSTDVGCAAGTQTRPPDQV